MKNCWREEALALRRGALVIYPTETFYALGCLATMSDAVERIFSLKGRPLDKPLPLIIADWEMAAAFLRLNGPALAIARKFWPGPLSIVTETAVDICSLAKDRGGRSAVRMTPHPVARGLCRAAGAPLVSSSANKSGEPPAAEPGALDPELAAQAMVMREKPWPQGGLPSTLVEPLDAHTLRLVRPGVLTVADLAKQGYRIVD